MDVDLETVIDPNDIQLTWSNWKKIFLDIMDECIPTSILPIRKNLPWLTKDFWKSIKVLRTSPDICSIPSLFDSVTSNEVKDNGDKAELLNHTFVSHFNTAQMPINHTDIPPVNPEDSCDMQHSVF